MRSHHGKPGKVHTAQWAKCPLFDFKKNLQNIWRKNNVSRVLKLKELNFCAFLGAKIWKFTKKGPKFQKNQLFGAQNLYKIWILWWAKNWQYFPLCIHWVSAPSCSMYNRVLHKSKFLHIAGQRVGSAGEQLAVGFLVVVCISLFSILAGRAGPGQQRSVSFYTIYLNDCSKSFQGSLDMVQSTSGHISNIIMAACHQAWKSSEF